jgi:hypothetical protein
MTAPAIPTATTVLDFILFPDSPGTVRMREIFSDYSLISKWRWPGLVDTYPFQKEVFIYMR